MIENLTKLQALRNFSGEPGQFWSQYLDYLVLAANAKAGVICLLDHGGEWRTLAYTPQHNGFEKYIRIFLGIIGQSHERCQREGFAIEAQAEYIVVSTPLLIDAQPGRCLFMGYLPQSSEPNPTLSIKAVQATCDLFAQYRIRTGIAETLAHKEQLAGILELALQVQKCERFGVAVLGLANELVARFSCDRSSVGWISGAYVRIKAISHTDSFEKKMEVVRLLESAMEESYEQDADISFPPTKDSRQVVRAHGAFAKAQDSGHMATLLLRVGENPVGVVCLERKSTPFAEEDMRLLRASLDQVCRPLADLQERDRWIGSRLALRARRSLARLLGFEHTWIKLGVVLFLAFLSFACLVPVSYRVDATVILRTDKVWIVTAPFDGFIDSVSVRPGDLVSQGQELMLLNQDELRLQEADLLAEGQNYEREIQKAQAAEELAQMRIFTAKKEQTEAKLSSVRYKLTQSSLRSTLPQGVVVDGDLEKKRGAPVSQGTELFRVALIQDLYAEVAIDESEIQNINGKAPGQFALKSRPELNFDVQLERVYPSATVKGQENSFLARALLNAPPPAWFRPGMTGVAKINAGKRTLWWIGTHRVLNFLRLKLWW